MTPATRPPPVAALPSVPSAALVAVLAAVLSSGGCRTSPTETWSARVVSAEDRPGAPRVVEWDTDGDGRPDYRQVCDPRTGVVDTLQFAGPGADGDWGKPVRPAESKADKRTLVVMLDGIPYGIVREMWDRGHFRLFHRPSRVTSVFPSMTDVAFGEMLCANPVKGYEPQFFDRAANALNGGNGAYLTGENEPWRPILEYRQSYVTDAVAYVYTRELMFREVKASYAKWKAESPRHAVWYFASSDAVGHMLGWEGCREYLEQVDRLIERVYFECRGDIKLVMFADHGNSFVPSQRIPLDESLRRAGLKRRGKLDGDPGTVVIPTLGMISSVAVFVDNDEARRRAESALLTCAGVDLICSRVGGTAGSEERFRVQSPTEGEAEIIRRGDRLAYRPTRGDPLRMRGVVDALRAAGKADAEGFALDRDWYEATFDHLYPDGPSRIARGLTGLTGANSADLLVSLHDGWYWGDYAIDIVAPLNGTHGALRAGHSQTFFMSSAAPGPAHFRQADMLSVINRTSFRFIPDFPGVRCDCLKGMGLESAAPPTSPAAPAPTKAESPRDSSKSHPDFAGR
jgi:hypothetical protein